MNQRAQELVDIVADDITFQRQWSDRTFGEGRRTEGVCKHIEKELEEIRQAPDDVSEWVDVMILAIDGATRAGYSGQQVIQAYHAKILANVNRQWPEPPEGGFPEDQAVEHVRESDS